MSESMKGQWWCTLAMVLVGSTVVASKLIGQEVEPFLATALRHGAALPVFLLLLWWRGERLPGWGAARSGPRAGRLRAEPGPVGVRRDR